MKSSLSTVIVALSILSLVVSIIALCISLPRVNLLNFDYLGLLVGILALLVTTLIGWNIYSLIDVKNIRKEQTAIQLETFVKIQETCAQASHAVADVYYRNLVGAKPLGDDFYLVYYRLSEMCNLAAIGQYQACESIIDTLLQIFGNSPYRGFGDMQMKNIWKAVSIIKNQTKINNFGKLLSLIGQMGGRNNTHHS